MTNSDPSLAAKAVGGALLAPEVQNLMNSMHSSGSFGPNPVAQAQQLQQLIKLEIAAAPAPVDHNVIDLSPHKNTNPNEGHAIKFTP
jgi:hypothetical protein